MRYGLPFQTALLLASTMVNPAGTAYADWQYGGTIDLGYTNAFQTDDKVRWRSKATTARLNEFAPNMGMFYVRKPVSEGARWGMELGAQAGYDTDGQVPSTDRVPGYSMLRYLSRANVSYLAPIGSGLTLTAGLMNSFIGYESMFAKDNPNYSRSWIADYSPYYLMGAGGQYTFSEALSGGFYLVSDYDYLAYRTAEPKYAGQLAWTVAPGWKFTQNLFAGPEQAADPSTGYWRYFSDSILQWSHEDVTVALACDIGTEKLVGEGLQTLWMGSALFTRWHVEGPWSVALRPEVYWDGDGRLTGNRQLIKAVTTTVEYKIPLDFGSVALRGEYRYDESTGAQGGFFDHGGGLRAGQHLMLFSLLLAMDKP
jgi:hypothetical protein